MRSVVPNEALKTEMSNVMLSAEGQPSIGLNLFREGAFAVNVQKAYNGLRGCQILARVGLERPEDQALRFGSLVVLGLNGRRLPTVMPEPRDVDLREDTRGANVAVVDSHYLETLVGLRDDERPGGAPLLAPVAYLASGDEYLNEFAAVIRPEYRLLVVRALGDMTLLDVEAPTRMLWSSSEAPLA